MRQKNRHTDRAVDSLKVTVTMQTTARDFLVEEKQERERDER